MKVTVDVIKGIPRGKSVTLKCDTPRDINTAKSLASYINRAYPELKTRYTTAVNYPLNEITITSHDLKKEAPVKRTNYIQQSQLQQRQQPVERIYINNSNQNMIIDNNTIQRLMTVAVENGIANFCERNGIKTKDEISQREAFRLYGEARIRKWEYIKRITSKCVGNGKNSKMRYSRSQIEMAKILESTI